MRKLGSTIAVLTLLALPAQALSTSDMLSLVAMPLAVAAVSNLSGVPQDDLAAVVTRLNQANVPPVQFVEVVRYVPAALVVNPSPQPTFVEFIDQQTAQGITGPALVPVINRQLVTTYRVAPVIETVAPDMLLVSGNDYVPEVVLARLDTGNTDPVALALMPLAVAAVADLAGVPTNRLADFVATLNNAFVPPTQFVQVLRYVPVALVADNGAQFVDYVQTQVAQGVTGPALITDINRQLPTYGVPQSVITVYEPQAPPPVTDPFYFPPVVRQQVARAGHPHGGPPGQLKKELGLQTGAEVVHGYKPGRPAQPTSVATVPSTPREHGSKGRGHARPLTQPMISSSPAPREHGGEKHGGGHGAAAMPPGQAKKVAPVVPQVQVPPPAAAPQPSAMPPGQMKQGGGGKGEGKSHGQGRGHGKG
jgi:hypothetical protein